MEQLLNEHYGLSNCRFTPLEGYISTNYRVDSDQGRFVLKVYENTEKNREEILAETAIVNQLSYLDKGAISQPVLNKDGQVFTKSDRKLYRLISFVKGSFLAEAPHTPGLFRSLGNFMAKIDRELQGFRNTAIEARKLDWDLANLQQVRHLTEYVTAPEKRKIVEHFFLQWDTHVRPRQAQLRKAIIHNDANDWNILVKDDKVTGIIDLGDAVYTSLVHEIAIALTYAIFGKDEPLTWAAFVIEGYQPVLPLQVDELDLLYYLVAARLITSVCKSAYEKTLKPDSNYITISEEGAWQLLEKWIRINPIQARNVFYQAAGYECPKAPRINELLEKRFRVISPVLSISYKDPIHMTGAAFQYMYDAQGNTFLDAYNNIPHVGHQHPHVVLTAQKQMAMLNTNTRYLYDELEAYASKLLGHFTAPLSKVYFVNSGSAASDLAIRLAQNYTGQKTMMVMEHGYHGNTRLGIDISHYKYTSQGGKGRAGHIIEAPIPDTYRGAYHGPGAGQQYAKEALARVGEQPLAGFIAEPIIGCGGQVPLAPGYLKVIYPAVRPLGGVCISDEVQTGFGRMGSHFWGFETQGVIPDIVVLGKPMANGHPMGAVVTTNAIAEAFDNGMEFFSSFGGNPVSCAIGKAVLEVLEGEQLQSNALDVGTYYMDSLRQLQSEFECIGDVRGSGLFIGVEFIKDEKLTPDTALARHIKNELRNRNILVSTDGPYDNVIKSKPPLCFTRANVDRVVSELSSILSVQNQ